MENKYYTPNLEDVKINYKCEVKDINSWYPWIVYSADDISDLSNWIKIDQVRTKYLDKEDIESLGWIYVRDTFVARLVFELGVYNLYWHPESNKISIANKSFDHMSYSGTCPSINELKFLMKLLNIH